MMMTATGGLARRAMVIAILIAVAGACRTAPVVAPGAESAWVGTWGTAPQLTEPNNMPPAPGLSGSTLRQIAQVAIGGRLLRARFSNAFGDGPLTLRAVHVAASEGGSAVDPSTGRALTFGGASSITIPAGGSVVSDLFPFALDPRSRVAITIRFGDVPEAVTGHPGSRTTSYLVAGGDPAAADLPGAVSVVHWYVSTGIDVVADSAAAVAVIGNSITDGRGSGTDRHNRWPDELARRLQADPKTARVAVLNQGIGGNCVLRACLGPSALSRFDRDVLGQSGVRWLIILEGINDVGQAQGADGAAAVARDLIAAYREMAERARARGIRVYGATLLPFGGSFYDSPEREAARQEVNRWIRTGGGFDAVIDLDAALRDPANPSRLRPEADTGDHLHPNEAGHRMIAETVDLALFAHRE
jgi:lysophospholipase L1-like esterase